jgi:long-chain acyl-CoA synthetase
MFDALLDSHVNMAAINGLSLLAYRDLVTEGMRLADSNYRPRREEPSTDSILILGVTSGTTGEPKAAMLSHLNFVSGQAAAEFLGYDFCCEDVYLSYAPLTHVYEQIMHLSALHFQCQIGYSSGDITGLVSDIQLLRPTIFGSFPAFYNKIYAKMQERIENQYGVVQTLLDSAIQTKIFAYLRDGAIKHTLYDATLFYPFRRVLGGRVRMFVSGGAPLLPAVRNFLIAAFSAPIFECYGCTETAGNLTSTALWERKGGHVGGVLGCMRMQLRDVPELDCFTSASTPSGQICVKGNAVMVGYFKNPEETKKSIDENGWLLIGDIGRLHKSGAIEVIDRVTALCKLQNGQFVAP